MYWADTKIKCINITVSKNRKNVELLTVHNNFDATPEGTLKCNSNDAEKIHRPMF